MFPIIKPKYLICWSPWNRDVDILIISIGGLKGLQTFEHDGKLFVVEVTVNWDGMELK